MNQLHQGARWSFRLQAYYPLFIIGLIVTVWSFQGIFSVIRGDSLGAGIIIAILSYILFIIVVGEIYARMSYNRWLYEITHDGVKIEHGIIWKKYTSIPYERVQNVDIHRGILARLIGFSTVEIETAGQSGFGGYYRFGRRGHGKYRSEGHLPAIDINEAEKIREFVIKKIKKAHRDDEGV